MDKFNGNLYPTQVVFKYPKAGEDNSLVTLNIHDLTINETQQIQLQNYQTHSIQEHVYNDWSKIRLHSFAWVRI